MKVIEWLKMPQTRAVTDLDNPATTLLHAEIIRNKPFLRNLYTEFYNQFKESVPDSEKKLLVELGSGGGFIKQIIGNVVTSDILDLPNVDYCFPSSKMPFDQASVDAFFMVDVLHHIADSRAFFKEALRCLKTCGKVVMIEPANTLFSRFVYKNFHHELFDPKGKWTLEEAGPLSQGNGAIPWIIFCRDRMIFEREFPSLRIISMRNHTPLRYLLSGGLTLRQLVPSFTYSAVKAVEYFLYPLNNLLGMFQTIELQKQ